MSTNKLFDKINDAVEEFIKPIIAKGAAMNAAELDALTKAGCILEKIQQIQEVGGSYDEEGNSYRRGLSSVASRYVSRDAVPHFDGNTSRRFYDGDRSQNGNGYSGHSIKDRMVAQLEKMYDEAQSDYERQMVNESIRRINSNK